MRMENYHYHFTERREYYHYWSTKSRKPHEFLWKDKTNEFKETITTMIDIKKKINLRKKI